MYGHVKEDGTVDYLGALPKKWGNISGLHLSDGNDEYLKTLGWLPLVDPNVPLGDNQTVDTDVITAEEDRVTLVHRVRDMTSEEITYRDKVYMEDLREQRNQKLLDSDWTQAPDHSSPLSNTKKAEWTTYRQSLRNLPATADMTKWPGITWPTEPS